MSIPRGTSALQQNDQSNLFRRFLILNQISVAMQSTLDLERLLHIVLSGATAAEGLGFNRAMLFLIDEKGEMLQGRMGVGPINWEECDHIWRQIFDKGQTLTDFIESFDRIFAYQYSELYQRVCEMSVPLTAGSGVLAQTVLEKKPFLIKDAESDPRVCQEIRQMLQSKSFATSPLIAGGKTYGVILVDNRFTQRPILEEDMQLLGLLANQAAVGVQNAYQMESINRLTEGLEREVQEATAELKATNAALQERVRELSALHRIALEINSHHELEAQMNLVVEESLELLRSKQGAIILIEELAERSENEQQAPSVAKVLNARGAVPTGVWLEDYEKRRGFLYESIRDFKPALMNGTVEEIEDERRCVNRLVVPVRIEKEPSGAIVLERPEAEPYCQNDLEVLIMIAGQASLAIRNARNYEQLDQQYRQLKQTQRELVKKDRLAFLGEMAAIVAHEIRNPLTAVKGFSQRMLRKAQGNEDVERYSRIVMEEVDRLDAVIADVLDFARRAAPKWQQVDIADVLLQTLDMVGAGLKEYNVTLSVEIARDMPKISGDPAQLKQVFLNICQNAIQAMPEGGALGVEAFAVKDKVFVQIQDTGNGIPEEMREKIFQPFVTTRTHGTGLGLSLALHIIEDHGGRISLESEVGEGTTFTIEFPVNFDPSRGEKRT